MYRITINNTLLLQTDKQCGMDFVEEPILSQSINSAGSFTVTIYPQHRLYNSVVCMQSEVKIWQDSNMIFYGRVVSIEEEMYGARTLTCEGALAFLNDEIIDEYSSSGLTPGETFASMLNWYNEQQTNKAHTFTIGTITVRKRQSPVDDGTIYRSSTLHPTYWSEIAEKLLKSFGGFLKITYLGNPMSAARIDWLAEPDETCSQSIQFAKNLLDCRKSADGTEIATCIVPLGATKSTSSNGNEKRSKISEIKTMTDAGCTEYLKLYGDSDIAKSGDLVKSGDKIYSKSGVAKYGWITRAVTWDDLTGGALLIPAADWLVAHMQPVSGIEVDAIDMADINGDISHFKVGSYVRVFPPGETTEIRMQITSTEIPIANPAGGKLTVGSKSSGISYDASGGSAGATSSAGNSTGSGTIQVLQSSKPLPAETNSAKTTIVEAEGNAGSSIQVDVKLNPSSDNAIHSTPAGLYYAGYTKEEIGSMVAGANSSANAAMKAAGTAQSTANSAKSDAEAASKLATASKPLPTNNVGAIVTTSPAEDGTGVFVYVTPRVSTKAGNILSLLGSSASGNEGLYVDTAGIYETIAENAPISTDGVGAVVTVSKDPNGGGNFINVIPRISEKSGNILQMLGGTSPGIYADTSGIYDAITSATPLSTSGIGATVTAVKADDGSGMYISVIPKISEKAGNLLQQLSGSNAGLYVQHPSHTARTSGLYKITVDAQGHVSGVSSVAAADLPDLSARYLPLSGGKMTGAIDVTGSNTYINGGSEVGVAQKDNLAFAGTIDSTEIDITDEFETHRTFLGTIKMANNAWANIISVRHRNGWDDGVRFGMLLYCGLIAESSLKFKQQLNSGTWTAERVLLDSKNYSEYALPKTGGTVSSDTFATQLILQRTGAVANGAATIVFKNGNGVLGIVGMSDTPNGPLKRWEADASVVYTILDESNYLDYNHSQGRTGLGINNTSTNLNDLNMASGTVPIHRYICKSTGGSGLVSNKPCADGAFILDVELIRWVSASDYLTMQTFRSVSNTAVEFVRYCINGTWQSWTTRVFTDTKPTDSGWQTLATPSTATTSTIKYRKYNKLVEVRGTVTSSTGGGGITCGTLPSGYRPSTSVRAACVSASGDIYGVQALASGIVNIFSKSATFFSESTAYDVCIQFLVD